ncbi:MAG TPA: alkaline shock response membrane anchor protein AmaP [Fusobacterium sp.]|uniref:alkaline shock response membrane anchor protein AmaP n=1 Tax=Fusobacterium sp. TaxID=68766 RepID=UPI002F41B494
MGKKILFFLAWLGIFCIGIFNIVYLVLPSLITKYITISSFLLETAILALSVLYILLAVYKLMTKFERNKDYQVETPNGTLVIAASTINKYVVEVLQKNFPVQSTKVRSHNKRNGIFIDAKMDVTLHKNVADSIQEIQNKIMEEVQDKLGIQIKKIKVHLNNMSVQDEAKTEVSEEEVK